MDKSIRHQRTGHLALLHLTTLLTSPSEFPASANPAGLAHIGKPRECRVPGPHVRTASSCYITPLSCVASLCRNLKKNQILWYFPRKLCQEAVKHPPSCVCCVSEPCPKDPAGLPLSCLTFLIEVTTIPTSTCHPATSRGTAGALAGWQACSV